ncbi:hypothetical protein ACFPTY_12580 [Halomonas beimenensis]|uniref:hypothetical protein n=1 Tax=Halomonas beimenensis TaxID=475662 RepID=UPI0036143CFA
MLTTTTRIAALAAMLALSTGPALADAERLEADLRARFAGTPGEFTLGEVSDSLLGGRTTAEDLSFVEPGGERVSVARYVVEGDYDAPDAVILEGLNVEAGGRTWDGSPPSGCGSPNPRGRCCGGRGAPWRRPSWPPS